VNLKLAFLLSLALSSPQLFAQYYGSDGTHGQSKIISAGELVSLTLNGSDGSNGSNGSSGSNGRCDSGTDSEGNSYNNDQRGGDGENGGSGGDGGNGGDLTVLFKNIVDLKKILFVSHGGQGGYGGDGGDGGYGCPNGSDGSSGYSGSDGHAGDLFLVSKEFHPYQLDTSSQNNSLIELLKGRDIVKNIWGAIDASTLLAPGSFFRQGKILKEYQYGSAKVEIKNPSMVDSRLLEHTLYVSMADGVTKIHNSGSLLITGKHSADSANALFEIERLYNTNEFRSIGFETVVRKNNALFINFTTDKDLIPRPTLSMKLKVELKGRFFRYHELFNGEVPAALIEAINSGYHIDLEQLPLNQKIPSKGKIRLSMNYTLQEMDIKHSDEEVWVVKLKGVQGIEVLKNDIE
jgi:hypothetical protein